MIYLVKSDDIKFRYFFTNKEKAIILFHILKERYHGKAVIQFKEIQLSDRTDLPDILDEILTII